MAYRLVEQDQPTFLLPALGDLIPENDLCRVVDAFVDSLSRAVVENPFRHPPRQPAAPSARDAQSHPVRLHPAAVLLQKNRSSRPARRAFPVAGGR